MLHSNLRYCSEWQSLHCFFSPLFVSLYCCMDVFSVNFTFLPTLPLSTRVRAWLAESCSLVLEEQNLLGRLFIKKIQTVTAVFFSFFFFSLFIFLVIYLSHPPCFSVFFFGKKKPPHTTFSSVAERKSYWLDLLKHCCFKLGAYRHVSNSLQAFCLHNCFTSSVGNLSAASTAFSDKWQLFTSNIGYREGISGNRCDFLCRVEGQGVVTRS